MITLGMVKNSSASDPETWKPLELTIDETRKDPTLLAYVTGRCSGLMFSLSKAFGQRADTQNVSNNLANKGTDLMMLSAKINLSISGKDANEANLTQQFKSQSTTIVKMADSYTNRMENNHIKSGHLFGEDSFMKKEIRICQKLLLKK